MKFQAAIRKPLAAPLLIAIDDDPFYLNQIRAATESRYEVITALSPSELSLADLSRASALILDLRIPGSDCVDFMESLKLVASQIDLLIVSGMDSKTIKMTTAIASHNRFRSVKGLRKPIESAELNDLLHGQRKLPASQARPYALVEQALACQWDEISTALQHNQFIIHFQPQINLDDGSIAGAEALVRWQHPTKGLLMPSSFTCLIESRELALPFALYVLEEAIRDFKESCRATGLMTKLSVNAHVAAFDHCDFPTYVDMILRKHDFNPVNLVIEITEHDTSQNPQQLIASVARLRIRGVEISIDDFGTGNSGLSRLKRMAFDELKVDRTFICDITTSTTSQMIVRGLSGMASVMNSRLVAEGIDTGEILQWLRDNGSFIGQGFLLSYPLPRDEFSRFMQNSIVPTATEQATQDRT